MPHGVPKPMKEGATPGAVPLRQLASQSEVMPQSDRITPSKPYFPRSRSVSMVLLKPAATCSRVMPSIVMFPSGRA